MDILHLLILNTLILFTFLVYLLYLRYAHLGIIMDLKVKATINLNFYVFLVYLSLFVLSLSFTGFVFLVELGGTALGKILIGNMPDLEMPSSGNGECNDSPYACNDFSSTKNINQNSQPVCKKDEITPNSPSDRKAPKGGGSTSFISNPIGWFKELSLDLTKKKIFTVSEDNLPYRHHQAVQHTINEFSQKGVLASTLNFEKTTSPLGYSYLIEQDGNPSIYKTGDLPGLLNMYKGTLHEAGVKPNISRIEDMGIQCVLKTNKFGNTLACRLDPNGEEVKYAAAQFGFRPDQLSGYQQPGKHEFLDNSTYSPPGPPTPSSPPSPTSHKNTQNPFN